MSLFPLSADLDLDLLLAGDAERAGDLDAGLSGDLPLLTLLLRSRLTCLLWLLLLLRCGDLLSVQGLLLLFLLMLRSLSELMLLLLLILLFLPAGSAMLRGLPPLLAALPLAAGDLLL